MCLSPLNYWQSFDKHFTLACLCMPYWLSCKDMLAFNLFSMILLYMFNIDSCIAIGLSLSLLSLGMKIATNSNSSGISLIHSGWLISWSNEFLSTFTNAVVVTRDFRHWLDRPLGPADLLDCAILMNLLISSLSMFEVSCDIDDITAVIEIGRGAGKRD